MKHLLKTLLVSVIIPYLIIAGCGGSSPNSQPDTPVSQTPQPAPIPEPTDPEPMQDICDNIFIPEDVSFLYDQSIQDVAQMDSPREFTGNEKIWAEQVLTCYENKRVILEEEAACIRKKLIRVVEVDGACPHQVIPSQKAISCTSSLTINLAPKNKCVSTGCARKDEHGNGVIVMERGRMLTNYEGVFKHEISHIYEYLLAQMGGHYEPWFILDEIIQLEVGFKNDWDSVCSLNNQGNLTKHLVGVYLQEPEDDDDSVPHHCEHDLYLEGG